MPERLLKVDNVSFIHDSSADPGLEYSAHWYEWGDEMDFVTTAWLVTKANLWFGPGFEVGDTFGGQGRYHAYFVRSLTIA